MNDAHVVRCAGSNAMRCSQGSCFKDCMWRGARDEVGFNAFWHVLRTRAYAIYGFLKTHRPLGDCTYFPGSRAEQCSQSNAHAAPGIHEPGSAEKGVQFERCSCLGTSGNADLRGAQLLARLHAPADTCAAARERKSRGSSAKCVDL